MKRIVFTFGTLYPDNIIEALLGTIPDNFYATLSGYSIYKAGFGALPPKIKDIFQSRNVDEHTFSYLFAKKDPEYDYTIYGRAYYVDLEQELVLDHWEIYPDWYRKEFVTIKENDGTIHDAFIYTLDIEGERLETYNRVLNQPEKVLANAKATRSRVMSLHSSSEVTDLSVK